jgi:protein-L-isoaspartate O-methyltransferase
MDQYTEKTKRWLDDGFGRCDDNGMYRAYQPIYGFQGFRKGYSSPGLIDKYIRIYQIMKALSHIEFDSLLDVGAAEGYTASIAKQMFGAEVRTSDLSEEACLRAREIFGIDSDPADIHELPYRDNEFDVVVCSETLEHVVDYRKALSELLRVAARAVVITVPHEDRAVIQKDIEKEVPHAHLHDFTLHSLDFLESNGYDIVRRRMLCSLLAIPAVLVEANPRQYTEATRYPKLLVDIYNSLVPILGRVFGAKAISFVVQLDDLIGSLCPFYGGILFVVLKDRSCYHRKGRQEISISGILDWVVPYHYLRKA